MTITLRTPTEQILNKGNCPIVECSGEVSMGDGVEVEGRYAKQEVTCELCGTIWYNCYSLSDYQLIQINYEDEEIPCQSTKA